MRLAVDNGRHPTTYIDARAFDEQAYIRAEFLLRGSKVGVHGRMAYDELRNGKGKKRSSDSVLARVEYLDPVRDGGKPGAAAEPLPVGAGASVMSRPAGYRASPLAPWLEKRPHQARSKAA